MNVVVAGATGLVGSALLERLIDHGGHHVLVLARRAPPSHLAPAVDWRQIRMEALAGNGLEREPVDAVCCCIGTTLADAGSRDAFRRVDFAIPFALAAIWPRAHFLLVSSVGASARSPSFYLRTKGELEERLATLPSASLHLFRPSMLLGEREKPRTAERISSALGRPLFPLLAGPLARYRGIEARDVARAMRAVLEAPGRGHHIYEYRDLMRLATAG